MSIDKQVYEQELAPWLPPEIIDAHVHVSLDRHRRGISPERIKEMWALEVSGDQSWERLRSHYRMLFPDRTVRALAFGEVCREALIEENNDYVLSGVAEPENQAWGLMVTRPELSAQELEQGLAKGFLGIKPYPDLAPQMSLEVSIYDFLPREHLKILNERKAILTLHLPRANRLADSDNIRELLEIADDYPDIKLIVAHIGRAYCLPTAMVGLHYFSDREGVLFDISAHLNADVFRYALETVGPNRILFGSDLPVTLMRGVREHVGDKYINYTSGDYSWNTNRKSPEEEAKYTFFLYEELKALIKAVQEVGLGKKEMARIMNDNAAELIHECEK